VYKKSLHWQRGWRITWAFGGYKQKKTYKGGPFMTTTQRVSCTMQDGWCVKKHFFIVFLSCS
jgi:hypothetical protein